MAEHNCEEIFSHIYEYINNNDLNPELSTAIQQHLVLCRKCYSHYEFETRLMAQIKKSAACACPDALKKKIKTLLSQF